MRVPRKGHMDRAKSQKSSLQEPGRAGTLIWDLQSQNCGKENTFLLNLKPTPAPFRQLQAPVQPGTRNWEGRRLVSASVLPGNHGATMSVEKQGAHLERGSHGPERGLGGRPRSAGLARALRPSVPHVSIPGCAQASVNRLFLAAEKCLDQNQDLFLSF